jgi:hypothetical protein
VRFHTSLRPDPLLLNPSATPFYGRTNVCYRPQAYAWSVELPEPVIPAWPSEADSPCAANRDWPVHSPQTAVATARWSPATSQFPLDLGITLATFQCQNQPSAEDVARWQSPRLSTPLEFRPLFIINPEHSLIASHTRTTPAPNGWSRYDCDTILDPKVTEASLL